LKEGNSPEAWSINGSVLCASTRTGNITKNAEALKGGSETSSKKDGKDEPGAQKGNRHEKLMQ